MNSTCEFVKPNMEAKTIGLLQQQSLADLNPKQKSKLQELKKRIDTTSLPSHIDEEYFFAKFLKAQKFNVSAAENNLRSHLEWRRKWNMENLNNDYKLPEIYQKYYPQTMIGHDNDGAPFWIFQYGLLDMKGFLHSSKPSDFMEYIIYLLACEDHEFILQTEKLGKLIDTHIVILDLDGFDMRKSLWKPGLELIIKLMRMYDSNFPCRLKKGILINAPKIFTVFYAIISPFFSEDTRKQIQIYGREGWKEELVKLIDPDVLPKHWGGNAVDEFDGNPYCSSKICMGGEIPVSYYSSKIFLEQENFETVIIPKNDVFRVKLKVERPHSNITWTFKTENRDIGFGITFQNTETNDEPRKYLKEVQRIDSELVPETGAIHCDVPGIYMLIFDNRFSWMTSKKLMYNVQMVTAETTLSDL